MPRAVGARQAARGEAGAGLVAESGEERDLAEEGIDIHWAGPAVGACDNSHAELGAMRAEYNTAPPFVVRGTYTLTRMSEGDPRVELLWRSLATVIDPEIGLDIEAG